MRHARPRLNHPKIHVPIRIPQKPLSQPLEIVKHNSVFDDIALWIENNYSHLTDCSIILGYNVMDVAAIKRERPNRKVIVYQLEQLFPGSPWGGRHHVDKLALVDEVWEYDEGNVSHYAYLGIKPIIVKPKFHPVFERVPKDVPKDIDILFYGDPNNPHRQEILNFLEKQGVQVTVIGGVFGVELDKWIARAKIILNIHSFNNGSRQEQIRLFYLLSNGKAVLSEVSSSNNYLGMIEEWSSKEELLEKLNALLSNDAYLELERKTEAFRL